MSFQSGTAIKIWAVAFLEPGALCVYGEIRWGLNMGFCLLGNMRKGDSSGSDGDQSYIIWVMDFQIWRNTPGRFTSNSCGWSTEL